MEEVLFRVETLTSLFATAVSSGFSDSGGWILRRSNFSRICISRSRRLLHEPKEAGLDSPTCTKAPSEDRKSTRLNSSHVKISYAVFCLKKKKRDSSRSPDLETPNSRYSCRLGQSPR